MNLKSFIGDHTFYKKVLSLALPIMLQNGISNLVNMVDNIMVGSLGTEQMSGVAIVNQILFVFNLCIFGGLAGIGIFTAQYYGKNDNTGIRHTFRLKIYMGLFIFAAFMGVFYFFGDSLISSFLHESDSYADLALAFDSAKEYISIMIFGLFPFMVTNVYASTLRETEKPMLPMVAGIIAVLVNLTFNSLLIFGLLGFPALGVKGAAIATVISRFAECVIIIVAVHTRKHIYPYIKGVYKTLKVPFSTTKTILIKSLPLLANETLWSAGMTMLTNCYSLRGLDVVAAANICATITNIFNIAAIAFGNAIAIIVGGLLGAGEVERAKDTDKKLTAFSFITCAFLTVIMACTAHLYPLAFNTTQNARSIARSFIMCYAFYMPLSSLINSFYFTLRSGGKTIITFVFDSLSIVLVSVPFTFFLAKYTSLPIIAVYAGSIWIDIFKAILGIYLVRKGTWAANIVSSTEK